MRTRIGALIVMVAVVAAACGGGGGGGGGGGAQASSSSGAVATAVPAICASLKPLQTAIATLDAAKPTDKPVSLNMAANGIATQLATFVSGAPGDLRPPAKAVQAAVQGVRDAIGQAGSGAAGAEALTTAIAAVDAAWKELEAKIKAACPG